jgi:hypothetical protein
LTAPGTTINHPYMARKTTNSNRAIALLQRPEGVTLAELQKALGGWQPHSVRGFISILGSEAGLKIESFKDENGARTYRLKRGRRIKVKA